MRLWKMRASDHAGRNCARVCTDAKDDHWKVCSDQHDRWRRVDVKTGTKIVESHSK